jgi:outer membrane lipoprotein-sorting protein
MRKIVFLVAGALFLAVPLFGAKINVFTADNIVQLVKDKVGRIQTFTGSFIYSVGGKVSFGAIRFKSPNKFVMLYYARGTGGIYETRQKIISDGKDLWLVFGDENVAIEETLEKSASPMVGWNINRLLNEYVPTLPKEGYKVLYNDKDAFKLKFIPKSPTSGFKYISMVVSPDGDILKLEGQNGLGVPVELAVKYDSFNEGVADKNFEYEPDENTQIYENVILPRDDQAKP